MSATGAGGSRISTCELHRLEYLQFLLPRMPDQPEIWTGGCSDCRKEESLLERARQLAAENKGEINRRVTERMARLEKQILKESKQQLEEYLESVRQEVAPQFEAYVRSQHYAGELSGVENEIASEELEKLKLKGA